MSNPAIILPIMATGTRPPKVSPEKAQKILADNGLQIDLQQAAAVLEFLYTLARTTQR